MSAPLEDALARLAALRDEVDAVDRGLLTLLVARAGLACAVSAAKEALGRPVFDPEREAAALAVRRAWASEQGLDPAAIETLFRAVFGWSREVQEAARARTTATPSTSDAGRR
jgi:chorismate mutase-like protein